MGSVIKNGGSNKMRKSMLKDKFKRIEDFEELRGFLRDLYKNGYRLKTKRKGNRPTNFKRYQGNDKVVRYDYTIKEYQGRCKVENLYRYFKIV